MSEGIIVALIGFAGAIIGASISAFGSIAAAERKNGNSLSCGLLGLISSIGALGGLILGSIFGMFLMQPNPISIKTTPSSPGIPVQSTAIPHADVSSRRSCPMIVIEGTVGGLPIQQTITWSELEAQGTTKEPQSTNLDETCSRTSDGKVQVFVGYWSKDPRYLDFRGSMTADEAVSLVKQNPGQPVIIVPWGE